jgi:NadR type nicotinamide-nucleotide adenylyltransferase
MEKVKVPAGDVLKIGITGPESSGKTWMARYLAEQFNDLWLPEYAREYLAEKGTSYELQDLHRIAREQLKREEKLLMKAGKILFCDTDILVLKIWYKYKFNIIPDFIQERLEANTYDLHLLMRPDIPYEEDPLRENPERGDFFFGIFRKELESNGLPYEIIQGTEQERTKKAGVLISQLLNSTPA